MNETFEARFWAKVDRTGDCWNWTAHVDRAGYGKFNYGTLAHRCAYELTKGAIPPGHEVDHLCRNPRCVNPAHLEAVTPRVNTLRSTNPAAINARKTHCIRGHELTPENTYSSRRRCKTCHNAQTREWKARAREASR